MRRFVLLPFIVFALTACGPGPQDRTVTCSDEASPPPDGKNLVRLGFGSIDTFQPIKEGDAVKVDYGSQGGKHIWVNVQSYAAKKSLLNYVIQLTKSDGTLVAQAKGVASTCGAGWVTTTNDRVVFEQDLWYAETPTGPLKLTIAESDGLGTSVGQELTITLTP